MNNICISHLYLQWYISKHDLLSTSYPDSTGLHFCYVDSACSGSIIGGRSNPEECCLPSVSGGLGAGSYAVDGDPQCFNCIGIVGENNLSIIGERSEPIPI